MLHMQPFYECCDGSVNCVSESVGGRTNETTGAVGTSSFSDLIWQSFPIFSCDIKIWEENVCYRHQLTVNLSISKVHALSKAATVPAEQSAKALTNNSHIYTFN